MWLFVLFLSSAHTFQIRSRVIQVLLKYWRKPWTSFALMFSPTSPKKSTDRITRTWRRSDSSPFTICLFLLSCFKNARENIFLITTLKPVSKSLYAAWYVNERKNLIYNQMYDCKKEITNLHIPLDSPKYCLAVMKMTTSSKYIWELHSKRIKNRILEIRHRLFPSNIVIPVISLINY